MYIQYNVMRFNTLFIIFTLDIKQCPMYMSLKNSLVETFSNNFPKLINNSSSLNSVNHKCDVFAYLISIGIDVVILIFLSS